MSVYSVYEKGGGLRFLRKQCFCLKRFLSSKSTQSSELQYCTAYEMLGTPAKNNVVSSRTSLLLFVNQAICEKNINDWTCVHTTSFTLKTASDSFSITDRLLLKMVEGKNECHKTKLSQQAIITFKGEFYLVYTSCNVHAAEFHGDVNYCFYCYSVFIQCTRLA